ncbi:unnamed protein product [Cyprideis torosa]|uniref:SurA N-terminal domain-containing protein n=1 Tax=Cyprideis torosa TaxID=163714 RepID=A0A7R8WG21_9CRUS|nr:unnamed protein product [Cyprideis torosa]CAG0891587.1 unnamed protein product [Cyprideis torosa]
MPKPLLTRDQVISLQTDNVVEEGAMGFKDLGIQPTAMSKAATSFGIAATVNKDAISQSDVNDRVKMIFASSGIPDTKENRQKIEPQALDILIDEQLKIQEAQRNNLSITNEELDEAFGMMAAQNKMTPEEFSKVRDDQSTYRSMTLMFQREVAERIVAPVGNKGAVVEGAVVDVTDKAAMAAWMEGIDRLDLVIANAGISGGTAGRKEGEPIEEALKLWAICDMALVAKMER